MWCEKLQTIKGIKPSEKIVVSYWSDNDLQYIVTKDAIKSLYFLYEVSDGISTKTKFKSSNPKDLEENIVII